MLTSTALAVMFGATFVILAMLSLYFWQRRDWNGGTFFSLLLVAGAVWAFFSTLEMATAGMSGKVVFAKLAYTGVTSTMPLWFLFALAYSQRGRWVRWRTVLLLWLVPLAILALTFTNEWHGLEWASVTLSPGAVLIYEPGPGEWVLMAFSYIMALGGAILLLNFALSTYRQYFSQTVTLIIGALVPMAVNALFASGLVTITPVDPTPVAIAGMGLIYAYSTLRYKLFDLVPVARERLITEMEEGILVIDGKGRVIDINPAARRMIDTDVSIGQPVTRILERWPGVAGNIRGLVDESREVYLDGPQGGRWLDVRATPIRDGHGRDTGRLVTMRDVTKRKTAEAALETTRTNLQALFDTIDDLFIVVNAAGRIVEINKAVTRRLGYARDEAIGMSILDLFRPGENAISMEPLRRKPPDRMALGTEEVRAKDGTIYYFDTNLVAGRWGGEQVMFGISRDVTERKLAGDALRESDEKFRTLAETTSGSIFIVQDGKFTYSNPAVTRMSGYSRDEIAAMDFLDLIHPDDREIVKNRAAARQRGDSVPSQYEVRYLCKNGDARWAEINSGLIEYNHRPALIVTAYDITGYKDSERKILMSLAEKDVLLKEIHDRVKNNLQIITSLISLQISGEAREDIREAFRVSQDRIRSMALIHEKLYQSGDLSCIDYRDYVESLVTALRRTYAPDADVRVEVDVRDISMDLDTAIPCGLIINELATNSFKYAFRDRRSGTFRVAMSCDGREYMLTISDDGPGLPPGMDILAAPSLGLRLVNALVSQIDGYIELLPGPGTTFVIKFNKH